MSDGADPMSLEQDMPLFPGTFRSEFAIQQIWESRGKGLDRKHYHASGWRIEHCGHPTALFPWAVYSPQGELVRSGDREDLGHAFSWSQEAKDYIELRADGKSHAEAIEITRSRRYGR